MKSLILLTSAIIIGTCAFNTNTANAQGTPVLSGDRLSGNQTNRPFYIESANWTVPGPYIELVNQSSADLTRAGSIGYIAGYNSGNKSGISHSFYSRTSTLGWVSHMRILQNGQVQIGQQAPKSSQADYMLSVDGKLVAKSIYVTAPGTWADFVFEPTYKRFTLPELEKYLKLNKHLPNIPSATDVKTNGYSISEMDTKLLQSVEELTLHVIELNKQNAHLQARVAELESYPVAKKITH